MPKKKKTDIESKFNDQFVNLAGRLGIGADNILSRGHYARGKKAQDNWQEVENAYCGSWVVGAMVDAIAEDMTRAGIEITGIDPQEEEELQAKLVSLGVWSGLEDEIKWARLYGGAIGVLMIDGQNLASELIVETVGKDQFSGLTVFDRTQLQPDLTRIIQSGPNIGLPEFYRIVAVNVATGTSDLYSAEIHHSRVIRQIGVKLPSRVAVTEQMWGQSVVERVYDRLISFDTATAAAANLINKAHLRMVGVDNLREILAAGGPAEEGLIKMFQYVRLFQTNEGITLLDKNDQYQSTSYSFSGLSDMLLQLGQQISGATGIPLVRLFGQSPAGLNSTGESDIRNYYDSINSQQESRLRLPIDKILRVLYRSLFGRDAPKEMSFTFAPLWQMSATEKAANAKTIVEAVVAAVDASIIPQSIALKEFKASSEGTGIFASITDEDISEAEAMPALPDVENQQSEEPDLNPENQIDFHTQVTSKPKALDKIKSWLSR